jgi:uncharacterized membrane protein YbhN (UPF0104 family)
MTRLTSHRFLLQAAVGYGAAAALVVVFLRNADWATMSDGLRSAAWPLLGGAVALRLASLTVAALRWQALLDPTAHVPLREVLAVTMMGMTAAAVAPMPAAELFRPYALGRRQGVDVGTVLGTATAEWFLDACAVVALFIPALMAYDVSRTTVPMQMAVPVAVLCLAAAGVVTLRQLARRDAPWWRSFAAGLRALESWPRFVVIAGYSVLFAGMTALSAWLALDAFGLRLSVAAGFLLLGLITLGGMVPTPGAVGGFHAVCQVGLVTWFGLDHARTVLPVIALHGVLYLPGAALGGLCFLAWPARLQRSHA